MIYEITSEIQNFVFTIRLSFSVNASTVRRTSGEQRKRRKKISFNCQVISFAARFIFHIFYIVYLSLGVMFCVCVLNIS